MNEKIREHVKKYNEKNGWGTDEQTIIETILEGEQVWSGDESDRRWWTDCFTVVEVDGMLIGFHNAITTGDESAEEKGWEFDPSSICEVLAKEKTITVYEPVAT